MAMHSCLRHNRLPARAARLAAAICLMAGAAFAQAEFALKDGDRVIFYGDSITEQRLYTTFVETYVVTRFPRLNVAFVHSGWGGDRVNGGGGGPIDVRLWRDVLAYNPSVVTIMLGMNDGSYRPFDKAIFDEFTGGYKHIVDVLKRQMPGVRITAIQPSPYDDVTRPPAAAGSYNATLVRYGQFIQELAASEKLDLADMNAPVVAALTRAKDLDAQNAPRLVQDRVHPGAGIHMVMAEALLKAWNAPAIVTDVEIDAKNVKVARQVNTLVADLRGGTGASWEQTDQALPMYMNTSDRLVALALRSSDFVEALNRQLLRVRGLAAGQYSLSIDEEPVASFTAERLSMGINLAEFPTPMMRQAAETHALTLKHNNLHSARWREVQVPMENDLSVDALKALAALDDLESAVVRQQHAAAQPRPRRYKLVPE